MEKSHPSLPSVQQCERQEQAISWSGMPLQSASMLGMDKPQRPSEEPVRSFLFNDSYVIGPKLSWHSGSDGANKRIHMISLLT
mmetsp:Transcript_36883/g.110541  ORF Transcript_36883/g.110541 Transcript_36883/m.110541 type:complete len:83 (-) Transcript_36883:119-367(-)